MSHQVVSFKEQFYRFEDALDLKNELCRSKKLKEEKIQALENEVNTLKEEMKAIKEKLALL